MSCDFHLNKKEGSVRVDLQEHCPPGEKPEMPQRAQSPGAFSWGLKGGDCRAGLPVTSFPLCFCHIIDALKISQQTILF